MSYEIIEKEQTNIKYRNTRIMLLLLEGLDMKNYAYIYKRH